MGYPIKFIFPGAKLLCGGKLALFREHIFFLGKEGTGKRKEERDTSLLFVQPVTQTQD